MKQESLPEMLCQPLESLILNVKLLRMGSPEKILAQSLDPPDLKNILQAVTHLKEVSDDFCQFQDYCSKRLLNNAFIRDRLVAYFRIRKTIGATRVTAR